MSPGPRSHVARRASRSPAVPRPRSSSHGTSTRWRGSAWGCRCTRCAPWRPGRRPRRSTDRDSARLPARARVGDGGQARLDRRALRLEPGREQDALSELLVAAESRRVVRDLVEDRARPAEGDRFEEVPIHAGGRVDPVAREPLEPARVVLDRRAPRDVVHRAGAADPAPFGRRAARDRAAAALAAQLPRAAGPARTAEYRSEEDTSEL